MTITFKGAAKRIEDLDLPRIGATIGVGEDEIHAFMDVEAAGSGFDKQGRPKMLFEPHKFYANTRGAQRQAAVRAGLARPTWKVNGKVPKYPSDSYPRLIKAMEINAEAALKSASWGLTQILGTYHKDLGYATAADMVQAFADDEETHLEATIKLLKLWKIDDDLRAHRWEAVAKVWNGEAYKTHGYHTKLAKAFARWQRIKDTPFTPGAPVEKPKKPAPKGSFTDKDVVERVQIQLKALGYTEVGTPDGKVGGMTEAAILLFRRDNGLPLVVSIDDELLVALAKASPRVLAPGREDASQKTIVEKVPEAKSAWRVKLGGYWTAIAAAATGAVKLVTDNIAAAREMLTPVEDLLASVPPVVWFGIVAIAALGIGYYASQGLEKSKEAFKTGARR